VRIRLCFGWAPGGLPEIPKPPAAPPQELEKEIENCFNARAARRVARPRY
jgi:hypothetical protein